jgi:hypothetical protein
MPCMQYLSCILNLSMSIFNLSPKAAQLQPILQEKNLDVPPTFLNHTKFP